MLIEGEPIPGTKRRKVRKETADFDTNTLCYGEPNLRIDRSSECACRKVEKCWLFWGACSWVLRPCTAVSAVPGMLLLQLSRFPQP